MAIEASDVVKLFREFGRSDPTCRAMAEWADHASTQPVLEVYHEALICLSAEKARLAKVVEEMLVSMPAGTEIRGAGGQVPYDDGATAP